MKLFLLSAILFFCAHNLHAQVQSLPPGKYETIMKNNQSKWERGDIILLEGNKYKISTSDEVGEYKFSSAAQRIFFVSGPLKSFYAKTSENNDTPAIVLPVSENEQAGVKLPSEVWCYLKH